MIFEIGDEVLAVVDNQAKEVLKWLLAPA